MTTNYKTLSGSNIAENNYDHIYKEYRYKWNNLIESDFPLFLDIEVTTACNLFCPSCYSTIENKNKSKFMEYANYKKIIDEASEIGVYGCKYHCIGRGEPLLHPYLVMMVMYAKKMGLIDVYLNTNGMLLNEYKTKQLLDTGLDRISFSIDGYSPSYYESKRPGGKLYTVIRNLNTFVYLRDQGQYKTKVRVQTIGFDDLDLDVYNSVFKDYCDEVGVINYKNMSKREYGLEGNWLCPQPWQRLGILYNGDILPCNHDDRMLAKLGNINTACLYKIWNGKGMSFIRQRFIDGEELVIPACDGCYLRTSEIKRLKGEE